METTAHPAGTMLAQLCRYHITHDEGDTPVTMKSCRVVV